MNNTKYWVGLKATNWTADASGIFPSFSNSLVPETIGKETEMLDEHDNRSEINPLADFVPLVGEPLNVTYSADKEVFFELFIGSASAPMVLLFENS